MAIRIYRDKEFHLLDDVYDPGEDSYLLVEAALKEVRQGEKVLEIGTGSGVVSFFLSDTAEVVATDINPFACLNARLNGVQVIRTDLFDGVCGTFDVVIFNPPYLPTPDEDRLDSWLNRAFDGGPDGRREIDRFLAKIHEILPAGGRVLTVFSSLTGISQVMDTFRQHGFSAEIVGSEKVSFELLIVLKCVRTI